MSQIHDDPTCPCHEFSARTPSEASSSAQIPREPENVKTASDPVYGAGIGIPVTKTAFGHHLDNCGVCASVAERFPDLELFDHQLCSEGRQLFRNSSQSITIPTFEQEWQGAPRWATNYTEQQVAEWWFIRGQYAKEVELLAGMNLDLREMIRVARERVGR